MRGRPSPSSPGPRAGSEEVAAEITAIGGTSLVVPGSVAKAEDCARIAETVADELGGIDVVVNSAFRGDKSEPFESADLDFWRKVYEVNLWGPLQLVQACFPAMKARGGGSVVNIASMSARLIRPERRWLLHVEGCAAHRDEVDGDRSRPAPDPGQRGRPRLDLGAERADLRRLAGERARRARPTR